MAMRMTRSMLALPILGVFVALGVGAAIWYTSAEPAPPKDFDEYLQRELQRLQSADAEDLNESARNIKAALGEGADTDDLVIAYYNENARRYRVYRAEHGQSPYEPPEPTGESEALQKAIEAAKACESAVGSDAYGRFTENNLTTAKEETLLRESQSTLQFLRTVLNGEPVHVPDSGIMVEGSEFGATWTTGLARVLAMRTGILAKREQWEDASDTARLAVSLPGHIHQGDSVIVWLMESISWHVILDQCLARPAWSEMELTDLLNHLSLRELNLAGLHRAEAKYIETVFPAPVTHESLELYKLTLGSFAQEHDYPPLEELIDHELESLAPTSQLRRDAAEWLDANPGELLDSDYIIKLNAGLPGDDDLSVLGYIAGWGELVMLRDCARLKLMWLKGKRGDAFAAEAERIAAEHGLIEFKIEDGAFTATQDPDHELSKQGHTFEPYSVALTE